MINKIKELYIFNIPKKVKKIQKDEIINGDGSKTTNEKEIDTIENFQFCIRKPNAKLINDAQLFYNVEVGRGVQEGLISQALLSKRLDNDGGTFSEADKEKYGNLITRYAEVQKLIKEFAVTDNSKDELEKLKLETKDLEKELQKLLSVNESMYNCTAESWARSKTLLWWTLNLLYKRDTENNIWKIQFDGPKFIDKYNQYCEIEDADISIDELDFIKAAFDKAQSVVITWYYSGAATQTEIEESLLKLTS